MNANLDIALGNDTSNTKRLNVALKNLKQSTLVMEVLRESGHVQTDFYKHLSNVIFAINTAEDDLPVILQALGEAQYPEDIATEVRDYYQAAIMCWHDIVLAASGDITVNDVALGQMVLLGMDLLNAQATWAPISYKWLSQPWVDVRRSLLTVWHQRHGNSLYDEVGDNVKVVELKYGLGRQKQSLRQAIVKSILLETVGIEAVNGAAVVKSILLETVGIETMNGREVVQLIALIEPLSARIAERTEMNGDGTSFLGIDVVSGRSLWRDKQDDVRDTVGALAIGNKEILAAVLYCANKGLISFEHAAFSKTKRSIPSGWLNLETAAEVKCLSDVQEMNFFPEKSEQRCFGRRGDDFRLIAHREALTLELVEIMCI